MMLASFAFRNSSPSSASAADAATNFSIWQSMNIAPLKCMGCFYCGFHPRKKCPSAWLLASLAGNYDAPEYTFTIMLIA